MNTYECLENEACADGIDVIPYDFKSENLKGLYCNNVIGISRNLETNAEKACILAEELGHHHTSVGNIIDQSSVSNRKQELHARLWAYNNHLGLIGIVKAYRHGCHNLHESAEYLEVTEEFFHNAIIQYRNKYGTCVELDNYIIFFEPYLAVLEKISD